MMGIDGQYSGVLGFTRYGVQIEAVLDFSNRDRYQSCDVLVDPEGDMDKKTAWRLSRFQYPNTTNGGGIFTNIYNPEFVVVDFQEEDISPTPAFH